MYASQADMEARFGTQKLVELTNPDNLDAITINSGVIDAALDHATALADSYALKRYNVPLSPVPPAIADAVMVLAYHRLHGAMVPEDVKDMRKDAMAFLRDVSTGAARLDVAGAEPSSSTDGIQVDGPDRLFSRDSMKGL